MENQFLEHHVRALYRLLGHRKDEYTDVKCIDVNAKQLIATALLQGEDSFVEWAKKYNGAGNVFCGRNPRSADRKVCRIGTFSLDLDPERPAGTAASDEMVRQCRESALSLGTRFPNGYCADSGNGSLLLWRVNYPGEKSQFERALQAFQKEAQKLCPEGVKVDETHDAARLIKVIGTMSTKGYRKDWRVSRFITLPNPPYSHSTILTAFIERGRNTASVSSVQTIGNESRNLPLLDASISPTDRLRSAEDAMQRLGPHRAEDYHTWLKVGFALKEFGDVGLQLWDQWSRRSPKYQAGDCVRKWQTFGRSSLDDLPKLSIGTIIAWANEDSPIRAVSGNTLVGDTGGQLNDDLLDLSDSLRDAKPPEWLACPFVARGSIVFTSGLPETLKTWCMADLAIEAARGGKWLDLVSTGQVNVLFLNQERTADETNNRFNKLLAAKGLTSDSLNKRLFVRHGDSVSFDDQRSVDRLCRWIDKKKIGLVIIDSFVTAHKQDENSRTVMQTVFETIKSIRDKYGCAIVFIDHETKSAFQDKQDGIAPSAYRMAGSVGKVAASECVITVKKQDAESAILYHTKSTITRASEPIQVRIADVRGGVEIKALV